MSIPTTPPSEGSKPRFESITSPCEYVERYRPGGYHPVRLDDAFKDGQYKIIRKLGEGSCSTVWLARDLSNNIYVALKILISDLVKPAPELQILHHLTQAGPTESSQHVTQLLDEFEHHGPNGTHTCLVFEPMGPDVNHMVEELPQFKPRKWDMEVRYPFEMAKSILKQSLQALAFLYEHEIGHGDFQPGNLLFCLDDISSKPEDVLRQPTDAVSPPVQRLDGNPDPWSPERLYIGRPLVPDDSYSGDLKIKLSDMGGAYFFKDPPARLLTPTGLRAPELILTGRVENSLDMWSFGCLVFELVTGQALFCVPGSDWEDDDHFLQLSALLGPLPDELFKHWKNSSLYYTKDRKLYNCQVGSSAESREPLVLEQPSMEEMFDQAETGLSEQESYNVKSLVRRILQYSPSKRPTPMEILDDPFFA